MVKMTQSFRYWLFTNYPKVFALIAFGHMELLTEEMYQQYLDWCKTEEGRQYLKGGSKYKEEKHE